MMSACDDASASLRRFTPLLLATIVALATVLRLLYLGSKSPWLDEISSVTFARLNWPAFWQLMREREANMLLYYLVLRGWMHVGNSTPATAKAVAWGGWLWTTAFTSGRAL